jgi:hypothetical protein
MTAAGGLIKNGIAIGTAEDLARQRFVKLWRVKVRRGPSQILRQPRSGSHLDNGS